MLEKNKLELKLASPKEPKQKYKTWMENKARRRNNDNVKTNESTK